MVPRGAVMTYGLTFVRLKKSRSQDNPLNPLENNRIKKTNGILA